MVEAPVTAGPNSCVMVATVADLIKDGEGIEANIFVRTCLLVRKAESLKV